jgi:thymidine kinase
MSGVSAPAVDVTPDLDVFDLALHEPRLEYLVCDEAQFFTVDQCDQLARVVDELGLDVFAFGLITDFRGLLFEGTKRLLEVADAAREPDVEPAEPESVDEIERAGVDAT